MKKIILLAAFAMLSLTGCYTVIWTPEDDFPTESTSYNDDNYYPDPYYGPYGPYYNTPWWYSISIEDGVIKERSKETSTIRNDDGGRGTEPRTPRTDIPPPTKSVNPPGGTTTGGSSGTTNTRDSSSSNTKKDTGTLRNDSGERKNDKGRK